jgi:hypothetical protein
MVKNGDDIRSRVISAIKDNNNSITVAELQEREITKTNIAAYMILESMRRDGICKREEGEKCWRLVNP